MYSRYVPHSTSAPTLFHIHRLFPFLHLMKHSICLYYNTPTTHMLHALSSRISPCHSSSPHHPIILSPYHITPHHILSCGMWQWRAKIKQLSRETEERNRLLLEEKRSIQKHYQLLKQRIEIYRLFSCLPSCTTVMYITLHESMVGMHRCMTLKFWCWPTAF
jgi:hypothetical protein